MIYVKFSSPDVSLNLAAEYYFAAERDLGEDVFMLWQPRPTIVVGSFQNIHEEVDVAYAGKRGIDIVRRLSGGGTVYQDEGSVQFAFIEKREGDIDFRRYLEPICTSLCELGIDAEINGRNDITVDGRKVSGNSQYRVAGKTVHHGTLLFSVDIDEMERATRLPDYKIASKGIKSVRSRVCNMAPLTDKVKTPEEFMDFLAVRMTGERVYEPDEAEHERISAIAEEKFRAERHGNLSLKSPKFDFEKHLPFDGGNVIIRLMVKSGRIETCEVKGDFFTNMGTESLIRSLLGCEFTCESVFEAVKNSGFSALGITAESLAERLSEGI
ncbi:MAG: lipoate--protein ligase [Clostridia bacterium]|nr:lipoate--protein ligase [Clostridia bacterium]